MYIFATRIAAQKSFSLLTMESIRYPAIKTYMEELVRTGKVVKEEAEPSDQESRRNGGRACLNIEVEEETEKSKEERVEEKNNAIKQLFESEINARSISIATVRAKYARIQFNATKMICKEGVQQSTGSVAVRKRTTCHQQLSWHRKRN